MTKFGILMTLTTSPMPAEKQAEAMMEIRKGFEQAAKDIGCKVECKVVPMPENYDLKDLRDFFIASA